MLSGLELHLAMSKAFRVDALFQYWHDKTIDFKRVWTIAMQVEKQLMDTGYVLVGE